MSEQMNKRTEIAVRRTIQMLIWVARSDMWRALWALWGSIQTVSVTPGQPGTDPQPGLPSQLQSGF